MHILMNILLGFALLGGEALALETYTIKPGDSLTRIARNHQCTVETLARENNLKPDALIHPGQKLKIPGTSHVVATGTAATAGSHTIQPGDTFSSISRKYDIPVEKLLAANPDLNPRALRPGRKILLGDGREAESTAATRKPATPATQAPTDAEDAAADTGSAPTIVTVAVEAEVTYGEFAATHGTDVARLNELNGLDLDSSTLLAKGSELYVPQKAPVDGEE